MYFFSSPVNPSGDLAEDISSLIQQEFDILSDQVMLSDQNEEQVAQLQERVSLIASALSLLNNVVQAQYMVSRAYGNSDRRFSQ